MSTQKQPKTFDKTPLPASFFAPTEKQEAATPEHLPQVSLPDAAGSGQAQPDPVLMAQLPPGYVQPVHPDYPFRQGAGGNSTWAHMVRYAELARYCPRGIIVEVGIGCGDGSTHAFDKGLQLHSVPASGRLHIGVDIHDAPDGSWGPKSEWFHYLKGDSQLQETVDRVLWKLPSTRVESDDNGNRVVSVTYPGILYIDTVHTYEFLKRELEIWPQLVGPDTLVLFHDVVSCPDMAEAIFESVQPGGVFHESHSYYLISHESCGLGALIPKPGANAWYESGKK